MIYTQVKIEQIGRGAMDLPLIPLENILMPKHRGSENLSSRW
jgi:hypothetical protein